MEGEEGVNNSSQMCTRRGARATELGRARAQERPHSAGWGPLSLITSSSLSCPGFPNTAGASPEGPPHHPP